MNSFVILAQHNVTAKALRKAVSLGWPEHGEHPDAQNYIVDVVTAQTELAPDLQFDHLADRIYTGLAKGNRSIPSGKAIVLVDRLDVRKANPMADGWDATIAMLILAFPEVRWVFGVLLGVPSRAESVERWHSLKALLRGPQADPLFDGSGLRNAVRHLVVNTKGDGGNKLAPFVPIRDSTAAAMDDEESYAYFNAFTAYRFGFGAFPVLRNTMAKALFRDGGETKGIFRPLVTFEDVFLSFPDNTQHEHYSSLDDAGAGSRNSLLGLLEHASFRIFVSTAHRHAGDGKKFRQNREYVESGRCVQNGRSSNRYGRMLLKPYSGMFALWSRSWLAKRLPSSAGARRGLAPGFVWPPHRKSDGDDGDTGHSAPGRLLQIATHMITRCETMLRAGVHTVQDATRCAVLATDAMELLGDRTPTTAMDALKLKHMAEVTAECQFSGVEYHIEIKPRLKEIHKEALSLSRWFNRRRKAMATMNAEMTTVIELMRIFRDHGQFDEALVCQNRVRHLHNRLWICQKPMPRIFCLPILKYIEVILASFCWFLAAIFGWMLAFVALLGSVPKPHGAASKVLPAGPWDFVGPWEQAFSAFTGTNSFNSTGHIWNIITAIAVLVGIAHVGIFISHVYMLVSRKD